MYVEANMKVMEKDNMIAFGEVKINNCICIKNVKLMKNEEGVMFVSMPRVKNGEEWTDLCYPKTKEAKEELTKAIIESIKAEITKDLDLPQLEVNVSIYEKDNLRGLATVTIDDFVMKNARIMDAQKGYLYPCHSIKAWEWMEKQNTKILCIKPQRQ